MNKFFKHLKIIHTHRKYVRQMCFKMGLYWQGLVHDLSKYSPVELSIYKYYNGKRSPHQECREVLGYSPSWIHHYHKNKHHYQYWWAFPGVNTDILKNSLNNKEQCRKSYAIGREKYKERKLKDEIQKTDKEDV